MEEKIREVLLRIIPEFGNVSGTDIIEDGMIDSMQLLEIIAEIEEEFRIEVPAEEMISENFKSVETIKNLIIKAREL